MAKLLIVDDDRNIRLSLVKFFHSLGHQVSEAENGARARTMLTKSRFDLLLTDLVMPAMGGRELIERARQLQPGLKVLCMSGGLLSPEQQAGMAYLQKPFGSRDLLAKARNVLGKN